MTVSEETRGWSVHHERSMASGEIHVLLSDRLSPIGHQIEVQTAEKCITKHDQ